MRWSFHERMVTIENFSMVPEVLCEKNVEDTFSVLFVAFFFLAFINKSCLKNFVNNYNGIGDQYRNRVPFFEFLN